MVDVAFDNVARGKDDGDYDAVTMDRAGAAMS